MYLGELCQTRRVQTSLTVQTIMENQTVLADKCLALQNSSNADSLLGRELKFSSPHVPKPTGDMQWTASYESDLPLRFERSCPLVGIVFVKKSTQAALCSTVATFPFPLVIVHLGKIPVDSSLDGFLMSGCELDLSAQRQAKPITVFHGNHPRVLAVVVIRVPLVPELCLEYVCNNVISTLSFEHAVFMESGIMFRDPADVELLADSARDTASTCLVEPARSRYYDMIG